VLYFGVSVYTARYLLHATHDTPTEPRWFIPFQLAFLTTMTLVETTQHLALLWVGVEATTLASAPLIYFYRRKEALEATWKYLLICSVGIALALLGSFCVGIAGNVKELTLQELKMAGPGMDPLWLKAGFICAVVGYGTKMGLVPLHTWLPDAHSQAPSPVSALMSGSLLNCALLAILRFYEVVLGAGDGAFARDILLLLGLVSVTVPAAFLIGQKDYKRLFAYSSIENMGVIAVGIGLGGSAVYGGLFHAINHSLIKGALFMLAGNLLHAYHSTKVSAVKGALLGLPGTGRLLLVGVLAISGMPPFGTFISEFIIFQAAVTGEHFWVGLIFGIGLAACGIGLVLTLLPAIFGPPELPVGTRVGEEQDLITTVLPAAVFCILSLVLGLYLPPSIATLLHSAAAQLGGG
jgi:hydrogenase-4 component F